MKALNQINSVNSDTSEQRQESVDIIKLAERLAFGLPVRHVTQVYQGAAKVPVIHYIMSKIGQEDVEFESWNDLVSEVQNWVGVAEKIEECISECEDKSFLSDELAHNDFIYDNIEEILDACGWVTHKVIRSKK